MPSIYLTICLSKERQDRIIETLKRENKTQSIKDFRDLIYGAIDEKVRRK